jgi:hypothetical protein
MAAGRPHGPNDPSMMSSLETALKPARRAGLVELTWNWRWELGILAGLAAAAGLIASAVGPAGLAVAAGAGLAAAAAVLLCWPTARRWSISLAWCLITPHRLRAGCMSAWVQTRSGKLPFILAATPADYGEQVRLWLRTGLSPADLHAARDLLAAACWATEVRVVPSPRHAHLVTLEVIRTRRPERRRPVPETWPYPRHSAGDGLSDSEERDTGRWPEDVPLASLSIRPRFPGPRPHGV